MLFTPEFINSLPILKKNQNNPRVVWICRSQDESVKSLRNEIESWYQAHIQQFPDESVDLCQRLRSKDTVQFISAYFELFLFRALQSLGKVEARNYELQSGKNIDFLFNSIGSKHTLIEVKSFCDAETDLQHYRSFDILVQSIQAEIPNTRFWFEFEGTLKAFPNSRRVRNGLRTLAPVINWESDRATIDLKQIGIPAQLHLERNASVPGWISSIGPLHDLHPVIEKARRVLEEKCKKYRDELPSEYSFIIALCTEENRLSPSLVSEAVYGDINIEFDVGIPGSSRYVRRANGIFAPPREENSDCRNCHVSGIIFIKEVWPNDSSVKRDVYFCLNPHASNPVAVDQFPLEGVQELDWTFND